MLSGEYDHLPEMAFYMIGDIDEVCARAWIRVLAGAECALLRF